MNQQAGLILLFDGEVAVGVDHTRDRYGTARRG